MIQAAPASAPALGAPSSPAAPTESIARPQGGLAAGRWEAPPWAFALVAALAVVGSLVWVALTLRMRRGQS